MIMIDDDDDDDENDDADDWKVYKYLLIHQAIFFFKAPHLHRMFLQYHSL